MSQRTSVLTALLLWVWLAPLAAQLDDAPSPTPVPFTAEPRQVQWRIGFDLGNVFVLEAPELNPGGDAQLAISESERLLPPSPLSFGLALLPFSSAKIPAQKLLNPRQWAVLDLRGQTKRKAFQAVGVFMGRMMTSAEGGYHLVSLPEMPANPFLGLRREPSSEDLIFAFAGSLKSKPRIRPRLSETPWANLLPVEDAEKLPAGYEAVKRLLGEGESDNPPRFLFGTSIEASIQGRPDKLWLFNYSNPDTEMGTHPWGIFLERPGALQPIYTFKPAHTNNDFVAYLLAAVDLDQNGSDDFVVEASYKRGTAYKVIFRNGSNYEQSFTSYYRGLQN